MINARKHDFISECGTASNDDIKSVCQKVNADFMLLMYSVGMVRCIPNGEIQDIKHLLEARLFGKGAELRLMRSTIDKPFCWRIIDDNTFKAKCDGSSFDKVYDNCILEEIHYLDIDSKKQNENPTIYTATGGGQYILPEGGFNRVKIRDYICYDDNGIANIADFVIVGFLKEGE